MGFLRSPQRQEARDEKGEKSSPHEIVERGNIYFIYRPRVEEEHPEGLEDIQQLHLVLAPKGGKLFRMINIGGKRLPDVGEQERNWGYVEAITQSGYHLEEGLRREERAAPRSSGSSALRGHNIRSNLS